MMYQCWPGLGSAFLTSSVLHTLRHSGLDAARTALAQMPEVSIRDGGLLLRELNLRLSAAPAPRILVDGVWFSRPIGGIFRVWEQILSSWALPGLVTSSAPISIVERDSHLSIVDYFDIRPSELFNPLDWSCFPALAADNSKHAIEWGADVFISSWISTCRIDDQVSIPELALVHDCIPERASGIHSQLQTLHRSWLGLASACLAVSADTAEDVEKIRNVTPGSVPWCHPAPAPVFIEELVYPLHQRLRTGLMNELGLKSPYVLLPATSSIGSYKNPELLALALQEPGLEDIQLVLTGLASSTHASALSRQWPMLAPRIVVADLTDLQLSVAYRSALAVILPSRVEGFGLPVVEALAAGATVLIADSRGLRESGGSASPRFDPDHPCQLAAWLRLLLDPPSTEWLAPRLDRRRRERLLKSSADLLGLALLAQARLLSQQH